MALRQATSFYFSPFEEGESEEFWGGRATPRLWFSRFEFVDDDGSVSSVRWRRKRRTGGVVGKTIADHEIESSFSTKDEKFIQTFYDSRLRKVRTVIKERGKETRTIKE